MSKVVIDLDAAESELLKRFAAEEKRTTKAQAEWMLGWILREHRDNQNMKRNTESILVEDMDELDINPVTVSEKYCETVNSCSGDPICE